MSDLSDDFYLEMQNEAHVLLTEEFGKLFDGLYTQTTKSNTWSNPLDGTPTAPTTLSHSVTGATLNYQPNQVDNQNILVNDIKFIMSAYGLTFTPKSGDTLTIDAKKYSVIKVSPLKPGNINVLYTLQLRAGGN